jgi:hypothetical protein
MFIGSKKIEATFDDKDGFSKVEFDDGNSVVINKELLGFIQTEEIGEGNIVDSINHYFSTKFLAELSMYELSYYFVNNVCTAMSVLSHNLREELIRKTFNCSGGDDINLKLFTNPIIEQKLDTKTEV